VTLAIGVATLTQSRFLNCLVWEMTSYCVWLNSGLFRAVDELRADEHLAGVVGLA